MSSYVLNNSEISGIANFAAQHGLGLAKKIGETLHAANVELWNKKYSKDDPLNFVLDDTLFDAERALESLRTWMVNTATSIEWFHTHEAAPLYNRIRQTCFSPEVLRLEKPETRFGFTVGQPVHYSLVNSTHTGYVVGFKQEMPSKVYGVNGLEDNCGKEVLVVLASQQDKSIYLTSAPVEYLASDDELQAMPAAQALNAMDILVKKAEAKKLALENERQLKLKERKAYEDELRKIMPVDAKSVIVASREVYNLEESDPMGDYHKVDDTETIILGFSKHNRALFSELHKFAKTHDKTAFLADLSKDHEDRTGYRNRLAEEKCGHARGWYVEKIKFYRDDFEMNIKEVPSGVINATTTKAKKITVGSKVKEKRNFNSLLFSAA